MVAGVDREVAAEVAPVACDEAEVEDDIVAMASGVGRASNDVQ